MQRSAAAAPTPTAQQHPCAADGRQGRAVEAQLERIDAAIKLLSPVADPAPILHDLSTLSASPCLEGKGKLRFDQEGVARPDSALSLRAFWEGGGSAWIVDYLDPRLAMARPASLVYGEPWFRKTLSRETAPHHPLARLLCSAADTVCIASADPFRERAAEYLELAAERSRLQVWQSVARDALAERPPLAHDPFDCDASIGALPEADRRDAWLDCFEATERRPFRFPLVGLPRLRDGWLVLSGRRGHYQFCDELRAYHAATGAAFVVSSCTGLEFADTGGVDHRAVDAGRVVRTRQGVMPSVAVQEALWFLLTAPELERHSVAHGSTHPSKVEPEPSCGTSAQSELGWSYVLDGTPLVRGSLTWDGCGWNTRNDYAVQLVRFAEGLMDDGCPPARPPGDLPGAMALSSNLIDTDEQSLDVAGAELTRAWRALAAGATCQPAR